MNAPDLIAEFAQRSGLPFTTLSDAGTVRFVIDDALEIHLEHDRTTGKLHIYASLGDVPGEDREAYFERLLAANLFTRATGGACIGLDSSRQEILLTRALDPDTTDYRAFETALEQFVNAVEHLRENFAAPAVPLAPVSGEIDGTMLRA